MTRLKKTRKTQMGSRLSEPEVDAALQLIQLSGDSSSSSSYTGYNYKHCNSNVGFEEKGDEESVGNSAVDHEISSAMKSTLIEDENLDDEASPPRNRKFRSVLDVYTETKPLSTTTMTKKKNKAAAGKMKKKARII